MTEPINPRIYPFLIDAWQQQGSVADAEKAINTATNDLYGTLTLMIHHATDPVLLADIVEPYSTTRKRVKEASEAYYRITVNKLARALDKITVALLQNVGTTDLSSITNLNQSDSFLMGRLMREYLDIDLNTGTPAKDGVSDRWIKMYDPHAIPPDDAPSGWHPPMVMVYMPDMNAAWWPEFFMSVRRENIANATEKAKSLERLDEMRRLGKYTTGMTLLQWAMAQ